MAKLSARTVYKLDINQSELDLIRYILDHFMEKFGENFGEAVELDKLIDDLEV